VERYNAVHAIFYATNMRCSPPLFELSVDDREWFLTALSRWVPQEMSKGDVDLLAEILLARWCLGAEEDNITAAAWSYLGDLQAADGSMNGAKLTTPFAQFHAVLVATHAAGLIGTATPT
jgi:hypothetical protein